MDSDYINIDLHQWKRRAHYEFFKAFDQPFFNITARVEVTNAYHYSKNHKIPFFLCYYYCVLRAMHDIPELRTRIVGEEVRMYEKIHCGTTYA